MSGGDRSTAGMLPVAAGALTLAMAVKTEGQYDAPEVDKPKVTVKKPPKQMARTDYQKVAAPKVTPAKAREMNRLWRIWNCKQ